MTAQPPPVFTSSHCLEHDPGPGHLEAPARLRAIHERVAREALGGDALREAPLAPLEALLRVHPVRYVEALEALAARGGGALETDTIMNAASFVAARAAAGAALAAVRFACAGTGHAFAAIRPPGHHALAEQAMGFCLFANVVVAAREAQALGRKRILIVDWDVHHGNGTQALVERDSTIRFISLHQWPWYPGTGAANERGVGNVFNLPRSPGLPPEQYVTDLTETIGLATREWTPEFVLISAGYDSMLGDPLGGFTLEPGHYGELVGFLRERFPAAPIVGVLEGGYAPERLAEGVLATLQALV